MLGKYNLLYNLQIISRIFLQTSPFLKTLEHWVTQNWLQHLLFQNVFLQNTVDWEVMCSLFILLRNVLCIQMLFFVSLWAEKSLPAIYC